MRFPAGVRRREPVFDRPTMAPSDGQPREEVRVLKVKRARLRRDGGEKINNNTKTAVEQGHHVHSVSHLLSPCVLQRRRSPPYVKKMRSLWKKNSRVIAADLDKHKLFKGLPDQNIRGVRSVSLKLEVVLYWKRHFYVFYA